MPGTRWRLVRRKKVVTAIRDTAGIAKGIEKAAPVWYNPLGEEGDGSGIKFNARL